MGDLQGVCPRARGNARALRKGARGKGATGALLLAACLVLAADGATAGGADVVNATAAKSGTTYRFDVTVRHDDTGWKHYANKWDVVGPDGTVLGTRILHHPHENEQPFTRSLSGVAIPDDVKEVTIRAYDSKHGLGGKTFTLTLAK